MKTGGSLISALVEWMNGDRNDQSGGDQRRKGMPPVALARRTEQAGGQEEGQQDRGGAEKGLDAARAAPSPTPPVR